MARATPSPVLHRTSCADCQLRSLCLPVSLNESDTTAFDNIVIRRKPIPRGTPLFRAGDTFRSIYAVRSGAVKATSVSVDGEEQVTGLHLSGEVVGLTAIEAGSYPVSVEALDTTAVCEIPFARLESLSEEVPGLQRQLVKLMSKRLLAQQKINRTIMNQTAEERLAVALLYLAEKNGRGTGAATRFRLPTSRHDLSNYLALAPETLSRLFKRLEEQGLITTSGREVVLLDVEALRRAAGQIDTSMSPGRIERSR